MVCEGLTGCHLAAPGLLGVRQGMGALVAAVMTAHRCGALQRAVLCEVADDAGKGLRYCVAHGKVRLTLLDFFS